MPRHRVSIAIRNGDRYLLLQRSATDVRHPGLWEFPGGNPEPRETAIAAAKREAEEETKLSIAALKPIGEWTRPDASAHTEFFFATKWSGSPQPSWEHASVRWLTLDEISQPPEGMRIGIDTIECARLLKELQR